MFEASSIDESENEGEGEGGFDKGFGSWTGWAFLARREEDFAMIWNLFLEGLGRYNGRCEPKLCQEPAMPMPLSDPSNSVERSK